MHIALVGCGFVGSTYLDALKDSHEIYVIDPSINTNRVDDYVFDGIILCLPTPANADGSCNYSSLVDVISQIKNHKTPILIKSTIDLEGWRYINKKFKNPFAFSPEFLRQDHAQNDLKQNKRVLLGGEKTNFWWKVLYSCETFTYKQYTHAKDVEHLIMTKYAINAFLATKVARFNQLYDLCDELGLDFESIRNHIIGDPRIGDSHTKVTKERGFGGACFPKDTLALMYMTKNVDTLSILDCAIGYNDTMKSS